MTKRPKKYVDITLDMNNAVDALYLQFEKERALKRAREKIKEAAKRKGVKVSKIPEKYWNQLARVYIKMGKHK